MAGFLLAFAILGALILIVHLALSAGIAGLGGGLAAFNTYTIEPQQFGFGLLTLALGAVILGGRGSVFGPVIGTAIFVLLPELARPLSENRFLLQGALLIAVITFLPRGIVDGLRDRRALARERRERPDASIVTGSP